MSGKKDRPAGPPLRQLDEIFKDADIIRCECGSAAFFDWGIQIIEHSTKYPGHRTQDWSHGNNVKICVDCKKPVVLHEGDLYDASEFVDHTAIDQLIRWSQEKNAKVPTKVMDP